MTKSILPACVVLLLFAIAPAQERTVTEANPTDVREVASGARH